MDLVVRGRRLEVAERPDVPAHAPQCTRGLWSLRAPGSAAPPGPPRGGGRSRAFRLRQMEGLRRSDLEPDPRVQFAGWFEDARTAGGRLPEAVALATATPD